MSSIPVRKAIAQPNLCVPPKRFSPAGDVREVFFGPGDKDFQPSFIRPRRLRGAKAQGLAYEQKGHLYLETLFPLQYVPSPWLRFFTRTGHSWRWCQPDGLIVDIKLGTINIIEFKLRHTSNAWYQTRQLYEPVVKCLFGAEKWHYSIIEVVKWFDPDMVFPEQFSMVKEITPLRPGHFGVHIFNPSREGY